MQEINVVVAYGLTKWQKIFSWFNTPVPLSVILETFDFPGLEPVTYKHTYAGDLLKATTEIKGYNFHVGADNELNLKEIMARHNRQPTIPEIILIVLTATHGELDVKKQSKEKLDKITKIQGELYTTILSHDVGPR